MKLRTPNGEPIYKNGVQIAEDFSEGHYGVQVGDMIYELNSTKGIPASQWATTYEYRVVGTHIIKNPTMEVMPPQ